MEKHKALSRIIAMAIALVMVISAAPITVFADEDPEIGLNSILEMGGIYYDHLQDAVDAAPASDAIVITLLKDATDNVPVSIGEYDTNTLISSGGDKNIALHLSGYRLTIEVANSTALGVYDNSKLTLEGEGEFNVNAVSLGYSGIVVRDNSNATVTNVIGTAEASGSSQLAVDGNVVAGNVGVFTQDGGQITVRGDVTSNVEIRSEDGIHSGAWTRGGEIWIGGSVKSHDGIGVDAWGGSITVIGDVTASGNSLFGARTANGGSITVNGNVTASGRENIGALAGRNAAIIIDGLLTGGKYIVFSDDDISGSAHERILTIYDYDTPTTKEGYITYSYTNSNPDYGTSYIWIKGDAPTKPVDPAPPISGEDHDDNFPEHDSSSHDSNSNSSSRDGSHDVREVPISNIPTVLTASDATIFARNAATTAREAGVATAVANIKNPGDISLSALRVMATEAAMPLKLQADNMMQNGKSVDVRINLNPALSTKGLDLSASTTNSNAKKTTSFFQKWYRNDLMTVGFGQQGSFGQTVRIAAKLNTTLDTTNLTFYVYTKETNSYRRIAAPNAWIDQNGYVHFTTELAGDIVISDGPLVKK